MDKIKSEIVEIHVDEATYKGTSTIICPTYINYFFGNNGTGKSTIAKVIKEGSSLVFAPGKTAADYCFHIFDQAFIDSNMHSYHTVLLRTRCLLLSQRSPMICIHLLM